MKINTLEPKNEYVNAEFTIVGMITYGQVITLQKYKNDEAKMQEEMVKIGVEQVDFNGEKITDKERIVDIFKKLDVVDSIDVISAISKLIKIDKTPKVPAA